MTSTSPTNTSVQNKQKTVVLIGHCGPDSSFLRMAVSSAVRGTQVVMADSDDELKLMLKGNNVDLLLFNRQLDYGFEDELGCDLIRKLRAEYPNVKMMLVSNYAEAQQEAIKAGALPGFGKREIGQPKVGEILRNALA